jgi:hypothetical protein
VVIWEKMKTGKKIAVGLALAITMFAAGVVSMVGAQPPELPPFTVTVSEFDVYIHAIHDAEFEEMSPGEEREMHSFDVANAGDIDAMVSAKFLTEDEGVYGFTGGSVIPADNFKINEVPLNNNGDARAICIVVSGETKECHTKLLVPPDQAGADYTATVELIFAVAITREDS